jgi:hypothetical protein
MQGLRRTSAEGVPKLRGHPDALTRSCAASESHSGAGWLSALRSKLVPQVSFFFRDHTRSVSEEAATFLVARLEVRSGDSETASALAERIATEAHRGAFAPPGQDLVLDHEEQQELLETLKGSVDLWPAEDRADLHELQLALANPTSQVE